MPKNIVVYSDGTGQDGGARPEQTVSNVYKMYRASRTAPDNPIDPQEQVAFYDPGLGTDIGSTALTAPWRFIQKLLASVTGNGIVKNIADCYAFIINHYEDGDRIFLIGFSRGAYTVRSLANLLMLCGVPTTTPSGPLKRFRKQVMDIAVEAVTVVLEHGAGHPRHEYASERNEQARRFRAKYGSNGNVNSNVAPYFIGVFDTVAALGAYGLRRLAIQAGLVLAFSLTVAVLAAVPVALLSLSVAAWLPFWPTWSTLLVLTIIGVGSAWAWLRRRSRRKVIRDFPNKGDVSSHIAEWKGMNFDRLLSAYVPYGRAANAIDENRKDFDRVKWGPTEHPDKVVQSFKQVWFAGNHSDIGGSYPETESRLSDNALVWMIAEASSIPDGLILGPVFANGTQLPHTGGAGTPLYLFPRCDGVQHCELAAMQDRIDSIIDKLPLWMKRPRRWLGHLNWEKHMREILPGVDPLNIHDSVRERFKRAEVIQPAGPGPYRPEALRNVPEFAGYYSGD